MPDNLNNEQLLELKLRWMKHRLDTINSKLWEMQWYVLSMKTHAQQQLELAEYMLADMNEISQEIANLKNL